MNNLKNYYSEFLNSNKLKTCYEIAPVRVRQYLKAEIEDVLAKVDKDDSVLDLGCGYGRVTERILEKAKKVVGIDISEENIQLARKLSLKKDNCEFHVMDAMDLKFSDKTFDLVFCIQNGISAFKVNPLLLIKESIRVTKKGGEVLFSSYSGKFWNDRLDWFRIQADYKLIGEIDFEQTGNGVIVCKDGFRATTYSGPDFLELASHFNVQPRIYEVDNSSIFCEMIVK